MPDLCDTAICMSSDTNNFYQLMPVAGDDGLPPEKGHMHMVSTSYDDHALRWRDVTLECRLFSILRTE